MVDIEIYPWEIYLVSVINLQVNLWMRVTKIFKTTLSKVLNSIFLRKATLDALKPVLLPGIYNLSIH